MMIWPVNAAGLECEGKKGGRAIEMRMWSEDAVMNGSASGVASLGIGRVAGLLLGDEQMHTSRNEVATGERKVVTAEEEGPHGPTEQMPSLVSATGVPLKERVGGGCVRSRSPRWRFQNAV